MNMFKAKKIINTELFSIGKILILNFKNKKEEPVDINRMFKSQLNNDIKLIEDIERHKKLQLYIKDNKFRSIITEVKEDKIHVQSFNYSLNYSIELIFTIDDLERYEEYMDIL